MKILYFIEDNNSATSQCAYNIVKEFEKNGHKSFVVKDSDKSSKSRLKLLFYKFKIYINIFRWPIISKKPYNNLIRQAEEIIKREKIDVIVSSYHSIYCVLAGLKIKKIYPSILYVPCFFDALYGGSKLSIVPKVFCDYRAKKLLIKILMGCDFAVLMRSVKPLISGDKNFDAFKKKLVYLDLPMLKNNFLSFEEKNSLKKNNIVFAFVGSLPNNVRNPEPILSFFSKIDKKYHLYLYGTNDYKQLEKQYSKYDNISFMGLISKNEANEVMLKADVLVNIGNNLHYMTPSKIFEYMSLGKRILSFYKLKNDTSEVYLSHYPNHLSLSVTDSFETNYHKFLSFIEKENSFIYFDLFSKTNYLYFNTPQAYVESIEGAFYEKK